MIGVKQREMSCCRFSQSGCGFTVGTWHWLIRWPVLTQAAGISETAARASRLAESLKSASQSQMPDNQILVEKD
jgi:hypothetical protein